MNKNIATERDSFRIIGEVCIIERSLETGEVVGKYCENNIVLNTGKNSILRAMSTTDTNAHTARTIKIGDDVGSGTVLAPEQPIATLTAANQSVIYEVDPNAIFVSNPSQTSVRFSTTLNGAAVMENFPALPNIVYTSAVLYTYDNTAIAYKRFPGRTISPLISVEISWTLTIL